MMSFRTPVVIPKSHIRLSHDQKIVMLGSCFSDNIGKRLQESKFNVLCNPFGTLYNPESIRWHIDRSIDDGRDEADNGDDLIFQGNDGLFHSWMHHSSFSAPTREELTEKMKRAWLLTREWLAEASTLIITFGSAFCYWHKHLDLLVANCHKQPDRLFDRQLLDTSSTAMEWADLIGALQELNPRLQVIFTISPIRHQRDGFQLNQLSKSVLFLLVNRISALSDNMLDFDLAYFPAYEIMMDELRDYRFYAADMIHPSEVAIDYIWQQFCAAHVSRQEQQISLSCQEITKALSHRPLHADSEEYTAFLEATLEKINKLKQQHPSIDLNQETAICNTRLKR